MKKVKRKTLLFMMLMAMFSPLALNAQGTFGTFTTGVDESRWITLDDPQTAMSSGQDDVASDLLTMGSDFSFPFGNGLYTQFWVNSNGMFSFSTNPAENEKKNVTIHDAYGDVLAFGIERTGHLWHLYHRCQ